jgi:hypothetical protein
MSLFSNVIECDCTNNESGNDNAELDFLFILSNLSDELWRTILTLLSSVVTICITYFNIK